MRGLELTTTEMRCRSRLQAIETSFNSCQMQLIYDAREFLLGLTLLTKFLALSS